MSYYGYPSAQAYGANYAQYAAAYAAQSGSYDQYQAAAAYNAAAYNAMQSQPNSTSANGHSKPGISISGTPQRYDYSANQQQQASTGGYDSNSYTPNLIGQSGMANRGAQHNGPKWGQLPGQPGANKFNKANAGGNAGFNRQRRNPTGAPVQAFYCEVCKISCAGPQTYKEHLDGQKHKKREAANKINEAQALAAATGAPVTSDSQTTPSPNQPNRPNRRLNPVGRTLTTSNLVIQCALCEVACTGKDAYSAHIRGAKHQKTIKLHQKLGKPIPPEALEIPSSGKQASAQTQPGVISAPPQMNRPGNNGQAVPVIGPVEPVQAQMSAPVAPAEATGNGEKQEDADEEDLMSIEPIGKEYIETKQEGKILSFYCKLCECQFNDPNAKDMHTKGRRHRLAYKRKVDPSLRVDMKGNPRDDKKLRNRSNEGHMNNKSEMGSIKPLMGSGDNGYVGSGHQSMGFQQLMSTQYNQYGQSGYHQNRHESFDDKHIIAKHNSIYPSQDEINAIQEIVSSTEKALKLVSDQIADEDVAVQTNESGPVKSEGQTKEETKGKSEDGQVFRALKGVMRVGLLAKGLLLKGDTDVQLIVLCAQKPTQALLKRVYDILMQKIDIISPDTKYSTILDKQAETIVIIKTSISDLQPLITCKILLTSPSVRTDSELKAAAEAAAAASDTTPKAEIVTEIDSADLLDKQRCLDSLAALRHAKWFQARASNLPNCVVIIRVLRDLCRRNPTWTPLSQWGLELLVEKCLNSSPSQLSPGEVLRRVLECVSSGNLLPDGPGLYDPCEKEPTDVSECLTHQQREELTSSAQMALRLLAFKQIYKILGMECITYQNTSTRIARKRPNMPDETQSQVDEKKAKEDNEPDTINKLPVVTKENQSLNTISP